MDCPELESLIARSARQLGSTDYTPEQIEGALKGAFGVDTCLIQDGTYFVVEADNIIVGCGGWSRRKTLFGGDSGAARDDEELDPAIQPAKIRAFFVDPDHARKGIGKAILEHCESEALAHGFRQCELMATLPGLRLYRKYGYVAGTPIQYQLESGTAIEFVPMRKTISVSD